MNKRIAKLIYVLFIVCIGTCIAYWVNEKYLGGIDDANIYFVYMHHFSQGHGFVYNIGGERVEGFTSLLWCLIGAVCFLFTTKAPLVLLGINVVIVTFSLWKLICFVDQYFNDKRIITPYSLFLLGALLVFPGYFDWSVFTLMETGLWSSLLILCFLNQFQWETKPASRKRLAMSLGVLLILLVLTRPESYLWGCVFIGYRMLREYQVSDSIKKAISNTAFAAFSFGVTIGLLTAWRILYFGFPFPNTYYAKVSQDFSYNLKYGYYYLAEINRYANPFLMILLGISLLYAVFHIRKGILKNPVVVLLFIAVITTLAIPFYVGGDHFWLGRLVQPTWPILYFAAMVFFVELLRKVSLRAWQQYMFVGLCMVVFLALPIRDGVLLSLRKKQGAITHEFGIARYGIELSGTLNEFFANAEHYPSQGVLCAGGLAYGYKGKTLDMLGLNNVAMAHADKQKERGILKGHASFNKQVFFQEKPDLFWVGDKWFLLSDTATFVIPEDNPTYKQDLSNKVFKGLLFDATFKQTYFPVAIFKEGENHWLFAYAHKEYLATVSAPYSYKVFPRTDPF